MAERDERTGREAVQYVADALPGLIRAAQWAGLEFLAYLLTMALTEAQWRRRAFERADEGARDDEDKPAIADP